MSKPTPVCPAPVRVEHIAPQDLAPRSLSIVVFGPGRGEAIVVFLPDGSIGIVDGCREPRREDDPEGRGDPVRELLHSYRAIRPDFRIRFVCLTHPHADHYAGLGRLMRAYRDRVDAAWEAIPAAGDYRRNLVEFVTRRRDRLVSNDESEIKGLERVFDAFSEHCDTKASSYAVLGVDTNLLKTEVAGHPLSVDAWAPHGADVRAAVSGLAEASDALGRGETAAGHDPNRMSGALSIVWGGGGVLLAGDTLRATGNHVGWSGARELAKRAPLQVVNVAHHASREAHDGELWASLGPPLAIVTPFQHGTGGNPPQKAELEELSKTCTVALTCRPAWMKGGARSAGGKAGIVSETPRAAFHAVGISLDAKGNLTRFLLAKEALVFDDKAQ